MHVASRRLIPFTESSASDMHMLGDSWLSLRCPQPVQPVTSDRSAERVSPASPQEDWRCDRDTLPTGGLMRERVHNGSVPHLVPPTTSVHASFLSAMAEFHAERRGALEDDSMIGHEMRSFGTTWATPASFADYVEHLRAQALEVSPRPAGRVPCTTLWYVEGPVYLGRLAIRHRLTPALLETGGHIGYDVRPSARRRGYATAMLRTALPVARGLGIDPALVTCDTGNVASRKVIEANGGVLEDERQGKLRFWVPTDSGDSER